MLLLSRSARALFVAFSLLFAAGGAFTQEKPDRPPWAQKRKANSTATATPAASGSGTAPSNASDGSSGEPGKIVQPTPAGPPAKSEDPPQGGKIVRDVNLVTVLASVLDDKNRPAPDLPKDAFHIYEEGVEQKIEIFEPETSQPLDLALMIDSSMSTRTEFALEQDAAANFIRQVLRPKDKLAVFSFDENVTQESNFSDNVRVLQSAIRRIPEGAGTSIYDAVFFGARSLEKEADGRRRVIILVTDGGETTSRTDFDAARKEAVRSGALLYSIILRPVKNENGRNTAGEHAIETITDSTGGALFFPDSIQELGIIFSRIDQELRTQYRLCYYPNPKGPPNTYRTISMSVLGDYKVRHRKTYLTAP
jgi:Ca-activated chloride channel family protein